MPFGPPICKFLTVDVIDEVVCLIKNDFDVKSSCQELACNGRSPWLDGCSDPDGGSCDGASKTCFSKKKSL